MELYEAVMTTRSMRRLTDDPPVTDEDIEHCLRAAAQAPSGGNVQPYHFIVLIEPELAPPWRTSTCGAGVATGRHSWPVFPRSAAPRPKPRTGGASS